MSPDRPSAPHKLGFWSLPVHPDGAMRGNDARRTVFVRESPTTEVLMTTTSVLPDSHE